MDVENSIGGIRIRRLLNGDLRYEAWIGTGNGTKGRRYKYKRDAERQLRVWREQKAAGTINQKSPEYKAVGWGWYQSERTIEKLRANHDRYEMKGVV